MFIQQTGWSSTCHASCPLNHASRIPPTPAILYSEILFEYLRINALFRSLSLRRRHLCQQCIEAYCHCDDCQRHSGSTYAFFIIVPPDTVTAQGPIKTFVKQGTSGCPVLRKFCQNCGSSLFDEAKSTPQELAIMAGSLDTQQKKLLRPSVEMWAASKLPFCQEQLSERYVHMPE